MHYPYIILTIFLLLESPIYAESKPEMLIPTDQVITVKSKPIYNLDEVLKDVSDSVDIPVLFPTLIKVESGRLYFAAPINDIAPQNVSSKQTYMINIGYTPGCTAHYCRLGYINAKYKAEKTTDYSLKIEGEKATQIEVKKVPVLLVNNIQGYFTPSFSAGTFVEPKIEWDYKDVLYTISWAEANQEELVKMANSAIKGGSPKEK